MAVTRSWRTLNSVGPPNTASSTVSLSDSNQRTSTCTAVSSRVRSGSLPLSERGRSKKNGCGMRASSDTGSSLSKRLTATPKPMPFASRTPAPPSKTVAVPTA